MCYCILNKRTLQKICMYIDIFPVKCRCEAKAVSKKNKPQCTNTFMITSYTNLRKNLLVCCRHKHPKLLIDSKFRNINVGSNGSDIFRNETLCRPNGR